MELTDAIMVMFESRLDELGKSLEKAVETSDQMVKDFQEGKPDRAIVSLPSMRDNLLLASAALHAVRDFVPILRVKDSTPTEPEPLKIPLEMLKEEPESKDASDDEATEAESEVFHKTAERKAYHFTFGSDHPLFRRVQRVWAFSECRARETMVKFYGNKWSFCYGPDENLVECKTQHSGPQREVKLSICRIGDTDPISLSYLLTDNDLVEETPDES